MKVRPDNVRGKRQSARRQGQVDLRDVRDVRDGTTGRRVARISRDGSGRWHLSSGAHEYYGEWANRVFHSDVAKQYGHVSEWMNLLRQAYPESTFGEAWSRQRKEATLYVAFDIRFSLEDQFNRKLLPDLHRLQKEALKATGKGGVLQRPNDTKYRDLYCFMLKTNAKRTARQIAAEVFPKEEPSAASQKVRNILSSFRRRLRSNSQDPN